jgi:hypothetical protein
MTPISEECAAPSWRGLPVPNAGPAFRMPGLGKASGSLVLGAVDPFVGAVGERLVFPDRELALHFVDQF